jgi:hypothetical protein
MRKSGKLKKGNPRNYPCPRAQPPAWDQTRVACKELFEQLKLYCSYSELLHMQTGTCTWLPQCMGSYLNGLSLGCLNHVGVTICEDWKRRLQQE